MRVLILLGLLMLLVFSANSQTMISGRVFTLNDKHPLTTAAVSVSKASPDEFITGTVTGEDGRFSIMVPQAGEYLIQISFLERKPYFRRVITGSLNKNLDLGDIYLEMANTDTRVTGANEQLPQIPYKPEKKDYPLFFYVTNAAGTLIDVLKTLPGVNIDPENKIILRGSDKIAILVDGQPSGITGFRNKKGLEEIPASQVESIKIINTPYFEADTAGMAGVVSIRFKKVSIKETSGDFGFNAGLGTYNKRNPDLPSGMASYSKNPKLTPSLNYNYKSDQLIITWSSSWTHQKGIPSNEFFTRKLDNGDVFENQVAENRSQDLFHLKFGLDWKLAQNQNLSFDGGIDYEGHIDTSQVWYYGSRNYSVPIRKWAFRESTGSGLTNLNLKYTMGFPEPGRELHYQLSFSKRWENTTNKLWQDGPSPYPVTNSDKTQLSAPEFVWSFTGDYFYPLAFGRLETGLTGRLRHMPVSYSEMKNTQNSALNYDFGKWFHWDENIIGAYANLTAEFKNTDIIAGLRAEYTHVKSDLTPNRFFEKENYNYLAVLPDVVFTIKASRSNMIDLSFHRNIDRPMDNILRIFPEYNDPELFKIGNPSLRPQYTDYLGLSYRLIWGKGNFRFSAFHKILEDSYSGIYVRDSLQTNLIIRTFDNLGKSTNSGFEISINQNVGKFWEINADFNVFRNIISAHTGRILFPHPQNYSIPKRFDTPMSATLTNQFHLPGNFNFLINIKGYSDRNTGQVRELARGSLDMGLKKTFSNNLLEFNLLATDLLNTMGVRQYIQSEGFKIEYQNFYESQVISLGIKYRF
jgi:hypothetical protein